MRTFTKSHKLDNVLYDVRGPVADEAARMEAAGTHILKLNIGNPAPFGFRTPDEVVYDMAQQLPETEGYSPSKGLFSARKAIMQYCQLKGIPNVDLNDIYLGNGAYGIEAAARTFFGKHVNELTIAEAAMIGGLPKAPSELNPYNNFEKAKNRQKYVLDQLKTLNWITEEEFKEITDKDYA